MANQREFWDGSAFNYPDQIEDCVRRREDEGFDGRNFGDSQNRYADPYVSMGVAAKATRSLKLSTGVTNAVTRHPAVMAAAIGSVQAFSHGRAVLGLARGDSALAHIGMAPGPIAAFEKYARALQGYLSGAEVPFELADAALGGRRGDVHDVHSLAVGARPTASRMQWLPGDQPKVPVDIFATGPKVIEIGARLGDRLTFAVGANPVRIRWALDLARETRRNAGLDEDNISYGAMFGMGIDDHPERGRRRIAGVVATSTRFSFMHSHPVGPITEQDLAVFRRVRDGYDMLRHSATTSAQESLIPDWFMDKHAVVGPPSKCIDRLEEIFSLGISRVVLLFHASHHGMQDEIDAAYRRFSKDVIAVMKRS